MVALVALAASVGIAFLHLRSDEQRERYEVFIELEARANRVDALESEANAERGVPLRVQAELTALLDHIDRDLDQLVAERAPGAPEIQQRFDGYRPLITEEFALLRAREFERADALDDADDLDSIAAD